MRVLHDHLGLAIRLTDDRFYFGTMVGEKYLCVIVKMVDSDAFVLTAYLTDRIKKGVPIWPREQ